MVIFYGSQTGNAQDVAERIGREAERRHLDATIISMDTYDPVQCKLKTFLLVTLIYATNIHMNIYKRRRKCILCNETTTSALA